MTRSLADAFSRAGLGVLAVDADPQGNLSDYYDADPHAQPTLGEVLVGQARAVDAVHGEVIPANLGLAEAELVAVELRDVCGPSLATIEELDGRPDQDHDHDQGSTDSPSG